jgi:hypothetical protein
MQPLASDTSRTKNSGSWTLLAIRHDTTAAQNLLNDFFALQLLHIQYRDRIARKLAGAGAKRSLLTGRRA